MAAERWPITPPVPGGSWVTILRGEARFDPVARSLWWQGEVLGPHGISFIKAAEGDLIPADDPRLEAPQFTRSI